MAAATSTALVVAAIGALVGGVQLLDERLVFEIRARDVFGGDFPLLGMRSSASATGNQFNHPGPLYFEVLALPVRLFGGPAGVTIGVALINIIAIWVVVLGARAAGGSAAALAMSVVAAALCWTLGSDLLVDPWQPNALVLPCLALFVATMATVSGRRGWLLVVVVTASLCAQGNLGFLLLSFTMVLLAAAGLVVRAKRRGAPLPVRSLAVSAGVGVVLWLPPLVDQVTDSGNLGTVLTGAGEGSSPYGASIAMRLWAAVNGVPPAWLRPGFDESAPQALTEVRGGDFVLDVSGLPSMATSGFIAGVVGVLLVLVTVSAIRRGVDGTIPGVVVVATATAAAVTTLALLPSDFFGVVAHKYRFLWSLAAFTVGVVLTHVVVHLRRAGRHDMRQSTHLVLLVIGLLLAGLNMTPRPQAHAEIAGTSRDIWPVVAQLRSQVREVRLEPGPVLVEADGIAFPDYFTYAVVAELDAMGVPLQVTDEVLIRQLGEGRRADGTAATKLLVRVGAAGEPPSGATAVAFLEGGAPELTVGVYASAE